MPVFFTTSRRVIRSKFLKFLNASDESREQVEIGRKLDTPLVDVLEKGMRWTIPVRREEREVLCRVRMKYAKRMTPTRGLVKGTGSRGNWKSCFPSAKVADRQHNVRCNTCFPRIHANSRQSAALLATFRLFTTPQSVYLATMRFSSSRYMHDSAKIRTFRFAFAIYYCKTRHNSTLMLSLLINPHILRREGFKGLHYTNIQITILCLFSFSQHTDFSMYHHKRNYHKSFAV